MSTMIRGLCALPALVLICGLLTGCGTTQSPSFYSLQPLPQVHASTNRTGYEDGLLVQVGPVVTPDYLDRSRIAVVAGGPEVFFSDINRWASPVEDGIGRVLIQNLGVLLSSSRIVRFAGEASVAAPYRVMVDVMRFDGEPGGTAVMDVRWLLYVSDGDEPQLMRSLLLERAVSTKSYAALVEAESALLGDLSHRIAEDIRNLDAVRGGTKAPEHSKPESRQQ